MKSKRGQSLIEALVAIAVSVMIVTGLIAGSNSALKNSRRNRISSFASKFAQDALEIIRKDKNINWPDLWGMANGNYCMDGATTTLIGKTTVANPYNPALDTGNCRNNLTQTLVPAQTLNFTRYLVFTKDAANNYIKADVFVYWREGDIARNARASTIYTNWK